MERHIDDLYSRICELRGEALDVLTDLMRAKLDLTFDETGGLVQAMQQVSNRLGFAAAVLAPTAVAPVAPTPVARLAPSPVARIALAA